MIRRLTLGFVVAASVACSNSSADKPKRVRKPPGPPTVVSTLTLPSGDGRVHVIDIPGRWETSRCLVHVGDNGSNITCLPQVEYPTPEYER